MRWRTRARLWSVFLTISSPGNRMRSPCHSEVCRRIWPTFPVGLRILSIGMSWTLRPRGEPTLRPDEAKSRDALLEAFDKNVTSARAALEAASDENWQGKWSLLHAGNPIFTLPRTAVMRGFVMNHLIHHRAQLGVYLRLLDVPVPSIYGPL